jgi:hypothetical protein
MFISTNCFQAFTMVMNRIITVNSVYLKWGSRTEMKDKGLKLLRKLKDTINRSTLICAKKDVAHYQ